MKIEYYENPQGKKIKNFVFKWDDISSEATIKHLIISNSLNETSHFIRSLKSQVTNNEKLVLFNVVRIFKPGSVVYIELALFLPQDGYDGILFDEEWILSWNEQIANQHKNSKSFLEWIKGFESRYPVQILNKMKIAWD